MVWLYSLAGKFCSQLSSLHKLRSIFFHSFGLEGLVTFKRENRYDPDNYEIFVPHDPSNPNSPETKIGVFDKVTVEITVEKVRGSLLNSSQQLH